MSAPIRRLLAALLLLGLAGCSSIEHKPLGFAPGLPPRNAGALPVPGADAPRPAARKIAIFFDGTANDEGSDTNVKRLHSLVTLQARGDIASLYLHGVGVKLDLTGGATGAGINARVRIAYEFVLNHYRHVPAGQEPDQIYLFGFSRGAYAARILTSMLYHAGVVRDDPVTQPGRDPLVRQRSTEEIAESVHRLVFPEAQEFDRTDETQRRARVQAGLVDLHLRADNPHAAPPAKALPVPVQVLGLWDTVEALGVPNWPRRGAHKLQLRQLPVNVDVANTRYGDKLCNVEQAFHAVSIDDNRAWIFTPLLLTRKHLFNGCAPGDRSPMLGADGQLLPGRLQEVWFAGAHSDVGGGYHESGLSGVSLNWMIENLAPTGLLPPGAAVRADVYGSSHDPEHGTLLYHAINRDVLRYALDEDGWPGTRGAVCVHQSVFERRRRLAPLPHENQQTGWLVPGSVIAMKVPNLQDYFWPWYVELPGPPDTKAHEVQIQRYPACLTMPQQPTKASHAP